VSDRFVLAEWLASYTVGKQLKHRDKRGRRDQLDQFAALMDRLAERRVLVHCQGNYRVTAFYALYASVRLGWSTDQADALIDRIWTSHPGFEMDETWRNFIAEARGG
jgi:hypothetical protein